MAASYIFWIFILFQFSNVQFARPKPINEWLELEGGITDVSNATESFETFNRAPKHVENQSFFQKHIPEWIQKTLNQKSFPHNWKETEFEDNISLPVRSPFTGKLTGISYFFGKLDQ